MEEEELAIDETGQRQAVEHIHRDVISLLVVLAQACIGEGVHSVRKLK